MSDVLIAFCTAPRDDAPKIARTLVAEKLCACVNLMSGVSSVYRWKGEVTEDGETLLIVKTTRARFSELAARLSALHPYEVPELIAWPVECGLPPYLDWVRASASEQA
jgi:periplasmic divalent cation tolerance protein